MKALPIVFALFALLSASAPATAQNGKPKGSAAPESAATQSSESDESMKRMQTVLGVLNQELTATYDQIKALQTALETNQRTSEFPYWRSPDIVTVDQVAEARRKALAREQEIQAQIDAAYKRIKDIEAQKQPILVRLQDYLEAEKEAELSRNDAELSRKDADLSRRETGSQKKEGGSSTSKSP